MSDMQAPMLEIPDVGVIKDKLKEYQNKFSLWQHAVLGIAAALVGFLSSITLEAFFSEGILFSVVSRIATSAILVCVCELMYREDLKHETQRNAYIRYRIPILSTAVLLGAIFAPSILLTGFLIIIMVEIAQAFISFSLKWYTNKHYWIDTGVDLIVGSVTLILTYSILIKKLIQ
jgi:uncharacterized membrane protein YeaQ/YmgE (transglycosylase-associated protein family)